MYAPRRSEITIASGDFFRPLLSEMGRLQDGGGSSSSGGSSSEVAPAFEFLVHLPRAPPPLPLPLAAFPGSIAQQRAQQAERFAQDQARAHAAYDAGESPYFEFFKLRAKGQQIFLTNMLIETSKSSASASASSASSASSSSSSKWTLFLLPCLADLPVDQRRHHHHHMHDAVIFRAFVCDFARLAAATLCGYALPPLRARRLHVVLDLDNTLMVSGTRVSTTMCSAVSIKQ
jgi:hypothetical protein